MLLKTTIDKETSEVGFWITQELVPCVTVNASYLTSNLSFTDLAEGTLCTYNNTGTTIALSLPIVTTTHSKLRQ